VILERLEDVHTHLSLVLPEGLLKGLRKAGLLRGWASSRMVRPALQDRKHHHHSVFWTTVDLKSGRESGELVHPEHSDASTCILVLFSFFWFSATRLLIDSLSALALLYLLHILLTGLSCWKICEAISMCYSKPGRQVKSFSESLLFSGMR
jgi:hypothetical protein